MLSSQPAGPSENIAPLDALAARIRAGGDPPAADVERALDEGFGVLMAMESVRRRTSPRDALAAPAAPDGDDLMSSISRLRAGLTELRMLTRPASPPRIAYGFVLPRLEFAN